MSKRHHNNEQDYIEWLKSLGCVYYAPLSSNGDTTDRISGQEMVIDPHHSVIWDEHAGAYFFEDLSKQTHTYIASWNGLDMGFDITNIGFTNVYECNIVRNGDGGYVGSFTPLVLGGRSLAGNAQYVMTQNNVWTKCAITYPKYEGSSNRYSYWYQNGVQVYSYRRGTTRGTGNTNTNKMVDVNPRPSSSQDDYANCKFYLRNAMIFNRALTLNEIKQIQGL